MKFKIMVENFCVRSLVILGLSLASASADPIVTCDTPPSGAVDWWQAEGNAIEAIKAGVGTLYPGTGFTNGVVGQAFSFDGLTGCVMNTNTPPLTNIQNTFTMEFWAYPQKALNLLPEGETNGTGITNQSYAIFPDWGGDNGAGIGVSVGNNGVSVLSHGGAYLPALLSYSKVINGWVHVAVVVTNKQPTLYLNGVSVRTGIASTRTYVYPSKNLGNTYQTGFTFEKYGPYQGLLDEVTIYNRALTGSEIQAIYAAGSAGKCYTGFPPTITSFSTAQTNNLGDTVTFGVTAAGPPPLTYQWSLSGTAITDATNASLTLTNVQGTDAGVYTIVVANPYGFATNSAAVLTVYQPPYIITQPVSQTVLQFSPVTFSVVAGGPKLHYQWQFKNANINKATNSTFSVASASTGNVGNYRVIITNSYASITSSNAALNVIHPAVPGTAVLDNGFLVSTPLSDGGYGYTNIPSVKIVNGGGSGAQAVAVVSNGVVTGIVILNAGIGYTNVPLIVIEPPVIPTPVLGVTRMTLLSFADLAVTNESTGTNAIYQMQKAMAWYWTNVPPNVNTTNTFFSEALTGIVSSALYRLALTPQATQAFASPILSHGFVVGANLTLTSGGFGYATNPNIQIVGGGGSNAMAYSEISDVGTVTNIVITSAGSGYTSAPAFEFDQPPATTILPTNTPAIQLSATNLLPYENYQLQFSATPESGWQNWDNGLFTPTNKTASFQLLLITNDLSLFRLQYVP